MAITTTSGVTDLFFEESIQDVVSGEMVQFTATTSTGTLGFKGLYNLTSHSANVVLTVSSADIAQGSTSSVWEFIVKDTSGNLVSTGRTLTIATEGAETIDGQATVVISADYGTVRLFSDGSNLFSL